MFMHRYVIQASASPEQVGEFVASFANASPAPLELRVDGLKANHRFGSPGSSSTQDFYDLDQVRSDAIEASFTPQRSSTVRFTKEVDDGIARSEAIVFGGKISLAGQLELPDDDVFARRVMQGYSAPLLEPFRLTQISSTRAKNQSRYKFLARVFEAQAARVLTSS